MSTGAELSRFSWDRGCVVRGPVDRKVMALQFTGDLYADGGEVLLRELGKRNCKATFYFSGNFYRNPEFRSLITRLKDAGHYLGPHGDQHLLYASWENPPKLLVTRDEFTSDLQANMAEIERFGISRREARFFNPAYQHFTSEIVEWARDLGIVTVNLTTGTRSHTDYMQDDDPRYVPSEEIVKSVLAKEESDPHGLNGFILHMHIGAAPGRTRDHLYNHVGELVDELKRRGYEFVRIDELLKGL